MRDRAVAVCVDQGRLLVMRRSRDGQDYTVLPGGGVEPGESPYTAVVRELAEETGLAGTVMRRLASVHHADRVAHYFLIAVDAADPLVLGGAEAGRHSREDRYSPQWIALADLDGEPLVPGGVGAIVHQAAAPRNVPWNGVD